ncbi:hypothetical protein NSPZN2_30727 [Nitrospira defluvii]|uniref:Uncharacterized protein n=1 Tax=Nitrospira defluvii TaxID=330214 RepID=A0ABM8RNI9_9BACT|nr:hypothetical protein NSPZN2_30727 [Nitrospira defluvii]
MASWEALSFTRGLVSSGCGRSVGDCSTCVKIEGLLACVSRSEQVDGGGAVD